MPGQADRVPWSMLTCSHAHTPTLYAIDLKTGSSVDMARWCLTLGCAQEMSVLLSSQPLPRKGSLIFLQGYMAGVLGPLLVLNQENRFLAFVKLWSPLDFLLWTTWAGPEQAASFLLSTF